MNNDNGSIDFEASLRLEKLDEGIKKMENMINDSMKSSQKETDKLQQSINNLTKGAMAFFTISKAYEFSQKIIAVRSQFQQLEIAFGTMLKSKEKANELMAQMTDLAAKTPFGLQEVSEGAKRLLAFQVPAQEVTETLRRMGDVAAGLGVPMGQLIHVYGQVKAQGKLMTNDLYQFMNAGIPIIAELSKVVGKSETEIKDMVSAGKIGFAEVQAVIKGMTDEGGLFYNLMAEQSKTLSGQLSNLEDNFDNMLNEIGKATEGIASGAISSVAFLVENYQTLGKVIAGLIATYGGYKTAILVNSAVVAVNAEVTKGWTIAQLAQYKGLLLLEKAQKLLNATMLSNPFVLVATAAMGLVSAYFILRDSTDANTRATERHNKLREEQAGIIDKQKSKINDLISVVQDETKTWEQRNTAFLTLKSTMKGVFDQYTSLNDLLRNMAKALKDVNGEFAAMDENMSRDAVVKTEKGIKAKEAEIKRLEELQKKVDSTAALGIQRTIDGLRSQIKEDGLLKRKQEKVVVGLEVNDFANSLNGMNASQLEETKRKINEAFNRKKDVSTKGQFRLINEDNPFLNYSYEDLGRFNQAYNDHIKMIEKEKEKTTNVVVLRKEILALEKQIETIENRNKNSTSVSDKIQKELEGKRATLEAKKKEYKGLTGDDLKSKTTKSAKSEHPIFDQEAHLLQTTRLAIDNELAQQKANIEQMQEGYEKELALVRYYYDEKAEAIRRGGEDARRALEKERADSKGSMSSDTYNARLKAINENEIIANKQNSHLKQQQEESLIKSMLEKYKGYDEKRRDIEHKFQEDKKTLLSEIAKIEAENVDGIYNERVKQLKKALKELEKLKNDELFKLETESQEAGTTISNLFGDLSNMNLSDLDSLIADAEVLYQKMKDLGNVSPETLHAISQGLENAKGKAREIRPVFSALAEDFKEFMKASKGGKDTDKALAFEKLKGSAEKAAGTVKTLYNFVSELNVVDLGDFSAKIAEIQSLIGNAVENAMQMGEVFKSLGGSSSIGMVVGVAGSLISKIMKDLSSSKEADREREARWRQQQYEYEKKMNDLYDERILKGEKFKNAFAENKIGKQVDVLNNYKSKINDLRKDLVDLQNSQVLSHYDKEWVVDKVFGFLPTGIHQELIARTKAFKDKYRALVDEFGNIDYEYLRGLNENKFGEYVSRMGIGFTEMDEGLKNVIIKAKEADERLKKYREEIDQYTKETFGELGANFSDSIISALEKGESAFENFGQTVSRVMKNIIKQTLMTQNIKNLFDNFDKAIGDIYANGIGLSNEQIYENIKNKTVEFVNNTLKPEIQKGEQKAKAMFDALEQAGVKMYDDKGTNRQAAEKGFARMSQDTGDELLGQFRLQTELHKQTKDGILQAIEYYKGFTNSFEILKNNLAQQLQHLAGIEANTYKLNKMEIDIAGIKRGMDELTTRGIKIRS
jgi:putative viral A-type inclusion protein|nr:MAG TPA: tail tape measure protein [Caudoviricetes sp.]